ncbi:MAG: hypothetical protein JXK95_10780 [Bacteroidales bacterium]|nr:hypothetical protein [Bacteroidales bacterium]
MRINGLNYEDYLADYLDGHLDPLLSEELMAFLSHNPEIEKLWLEPESRDNTLSAKTFPCPDKEALKKGYDDIIDINEFNFDEFCVAETEGLLTDPDRKRLSEYISLHPRKAFDHELFRHTLIGPDHKIQYPDKENLKKKTALKSFRNFSFYALRIAAAITVLILMITIKHEKESISPEYTDAIMTGDIKQEKSTPKRPVENTEDKSVISHAIKAKTDEKNGFPPDADDYNSPVMLPLKASIPSGLLPVPGIVSKPVGRSLNRKPLISQDQPSYNAMTTEKNAGNEMTDLLGLLQKVDVMKTAEGIVKGFNHLTEARLELNSAVDDQGKLSELVFRSESFIIASFNKN